MVVTPDFGTSVLFDVWFNAVVSSFGCGYFDVLFLCASDTYKPIGFGLSP